MQIRVGKSEIEISIQVTVVYLRNDHQMVSSPKTAFFYIPVGSQTKENEIHSANFSVFRCIILSFLGIWPFLSIATASV